MSAEHYPFSLRHLAIATLRNLAAADIELVEGLNVIAGDNGEGKTSVLEAIYLLATSRSFRTAKLSEVVSLGAATGAVRGTFVEDRPEIEIRRVQSVGLTGGRRTLRIDGQAPKTQTAYAVQSPVIAFDPQQMILSMGSSAGRRTLLDRVTLFTHPGVSAHRTRYQRAMKERQRILTEAGQGFASRATELEAFEQLMAEHGAFLTRARHGVCEGLASAAMSAFEEFADEKLRLLASYEPGGHDDPNRCIEELRTRRPRDAKAKRCTFGPHRDDVGLRLNGNPARVVASQGQHRAITLALKIAELQLVSTATGLVPILLLDDVSSELDPHRTKALFSMLRKNRGQVVLTTTRRDLIVSEGDLGNRRDFSVTNGVISMVE